MTESDYRWLANDNLPGQTIRVVAGSEWHYAQGGWHETDPVPELTAADIEAESSPSEASNEGENIPADIPDVDQDAEPVAELAEDEQEPDTETPEEESE